MVWPTMINILLCILTKQGCVDVNDNHVWWITIYSDNNIYLRNRKSGFSVWSTQQWKSSSARKSSFDTVGNEHTQTLGLYLVKKHFKPLFFNLFFKLRFYSLMPKRQNKDEHFSPALWSMTTSYTEGLSFFSGDSLYSLLNEAAVCFICSLVTASMSLSSPNYTRQICWLNFMQQNHRNLRVYVHIKLLVILQFQLQSQSEHCKTDFTKLNVKILLEIKEKTKCKKAYMLFMLLQLYWTAELL